MLGDPAKGTELQAMSSQRPLLRLLADETGATAIEYALLAALIAGVLIGAMGTMGRTMLGLYFGANTTLATEIGKASADVTGE